MKVEVTVHSTQELTEWLMTHYPNDEFGRDEVVVRLVRDAVKE